MGSDGITQSLGGWKDGYGSLVSYCYCRRPDFGSWPPLLWSHKCLLLQLQGTQCPLLVPTGTSAHVDIDTHGHIKKKKNLFKLSAFKNSKNQNVACEESLFTPLSPSPPTKPGLFSQAWVCLPH